MQTSHINYVLMAIFIYILETGTKTEDKGETSGSNVAAMVPGSSCTPCFHCSAPTGVTGLWGPCSPHALLGWDGPLIFACTFPRGRDWVSLCVCALPCTFPPSAIFPTV